MSWALDYYLSDQRKKQIQAAEFLGLTVTYDYEKADNTVTATVTFKKNATEIGSFIINIDYTNLLDHIQTRIDAATADYQKWNGLKTQVENL